MINVASLHYKLHKARPPLHCVLRAYNTQEMLKNMHWVEKRMGIAIRCMMPYLRRQGLISQLKALQFKALDYECQGGGVYKKVRLLHSGARQLGFVPGPPLSSSMVTVSSLTSLSPNFLQCKSKDSNSTSVTGFP